MKRTAEPKTSTGRWRLILILTLLVAAALRLWGLPGIPPGPHYDEAANGVLAAEIAHGDETPLFITSYTGKEALFFYWTAAWMRLLGHNLLALRLPAALAGLLTIAATAWLVYELFSDDDPQGAPWLAALTAALLATSFWHVLLSRIGFRAIMQPLFQALTLAALWRGLRLSHRRWLLLSGLFCGLTGYTYLAARAFPVPLAVALLVLLIADASQRRRRLGQFGLFGLAALASFAPLGLYFLRHPDDFGTRMDQVGPGNDWRAALDGVVTALKMIFLRGDPYVRFNLPFRPLLGPVVACLFVVGLGVTAWRLFRSRTVLSRAREILLLVWLPVMLLPTALAINEITPSNLRAVGLIPLVFVFPARAVMIVVSDRWSVASGRFWVTCVLLVATALVTARAYFWEYAPRTDLYEASDGDLADIAAYLNQADPSSASVYVGSIHYRHPTLAFLAEDYTQVKWLVGAATVVYPPDGEALYLFPRSATPDADWLARYLPDATPIEAPAAPDGRPAFIGYRLANPPPGEVEAPGESALADFSGVVRLLSYQVERAVSGAEADVTVIWQILAEPPFADLGPFYHLVTPWGFRWGQADPFHYAAKDWTPGEIVVERVRVPIAPGAPPGDYALKAGFYSQGADARLAVIDAAGRYAGATAPLTVTVARAAAPPDLADLGMRQRLNLRTDGGLTLLGFNLDTAQARPGERVHLTLFWRAEGRPGDYAVNLSLLAVGENDLALYSGAPVHGAYPTKRWTGGEIIVDRYDPRLPLAAADAPPGDYALALSLTGTDGEKLLDALILGQLTLIATERAFEMPDISHAQHARLSTQIEFLGYDLDLSDARPGGTLHLTLYWRALAEMDAGYTVFTHLLDAENRRAAGQDNPPVNGAYPTTLWLPGEIITDLYPIALPLDLPPGDYSIEIGFYLPENGLRLSDAILLNTIIPIPP